MSCRFVELTCQRLLGPLSTETMKRRSAVTAGFSLVALLGSCSKDPSSEAKIADQSVASATASTGAAAGAGGGNSQSTGMGGGTAGNGGQGGEMPAGEHAPPVAEILFPPRGAIAAGTVT